MRRDDRPSVVLVLALLLSGCGPLGQGGDGQRTAQDTGWLAASSFEVSGFLTSQVTHAATGRYAGLADDTLQQQQLVETHLKFGKPAMLEHGYQMGQLVEQLEILDVDTDQQTNEVTLRYRAKLNLIFPDRHLSRVPALDELEQLRFNLVLPRDPVNVMAQAGDSCAAGYGDKTLSEYKFYYYFHPEADACQLELTDGLLEITEVLPALYAYPEYDRLVRPLGQGLRGFTVAVMAGEAASTGRRHLVNGLDVELAPEQPADVERFIWHQDGLQVTIDLYDRHNHPHFTQAFRDALGTYDVVYYHGHSNYGTQPYLTIPDAFSERYQIISMNSCRNYSYYAEQIFRAKATPEDPRGFDAVDFLANGDSNWISRSFVSLPVLLENLITGAQAVAQGRPQDAPSWLEIVSQIDAADPGVFYGAAGVRGNHWTPQSALGAQ